MVNQNGQLVLYTINKFDEPVTIAQIVAAIANAANVPVLSMRDVVEQTVRQGVESGYIQKKGSKFYSAPQNAFESILKEEITASPLNTKISPTCDESGSTRNVAQRSLSPSQQSTSAIFKKPEVPAKSEESKANASVSRRSSKLNDLQEKNMTPSRRQSKVNNTQEKNVSSSKRSSKPAKSRTPNTAALRSLRSRKPAAKAPTRRKATK